MPKINAVFPAMARPLIEPHLPDDIDAHWFSTAEEAFALAPHAEIGWLDMQQPHNVGKAITAGERLKWVSTIYAGLDAFPLDLLRERGTVLTNGVGINTIAVAEYAVMGVLVAAKGFADVIRAQDRREWLFASPGTTELCESKALVIGYGAIGSAIGERLKGFGVQVTGVKRSPSADPTIITPDAWRPLLGEFDWIILAAPSTDETQALIGAAELAAMKFSAWLVNIARGDLVDQDALIAALERKRIAGAFLDVTTPEPLPSESPLWSMPSVILTAHLSGRAQTRMFERSTELFLRNLERYRTGQPLENQVDLVLGY